MQITVKKWGNSAAVRLPAKVVHAARVGIEQRVEVRVEGRKIVLDPAIEADNLDALLAQITPENVHHEIDYLMCQTPAILSGWILIHQQDMNKQGIDRPSCCHQSSIIVKPSSWSVFRSPVGPKAFLLRLVHL